MTPYQSFNFAVEIEGLLVGGFSEVSGLEGTIEVEEYREGGVNGFVHKLPVRTSHANLVLSRGLTSVSTLWNWYYNTSLGSIQRRNGTLMLLDARQLPVMWWNFRNALPVRWAGPTFSATSDEVAVEALELAHEGLTRPLLGQAVAITGDVARLAGRQ
ncbi:MAG TPA: phage tail protein [Streptosporangiaceae bacterium]|nr:phage tail protein [Streptosporangiaceae bacterium]